MNISDTILIAGAHGLVGSAIVRQLRAQGYTHILSPSRDELDYTSKDSVNEYFSKYKPQFVLIAAAKVGGILANDTYPVDFLLTNLTIQNTLIEACHTHAVQKTLFLGSSCIYPKLAPQPLKEEYLLTGPLEPTNEWYAIAKIAGIKLCQAYHKQYGDSMISVMPTNLYGINDNFDLKSSHVLPAMIRKFHEAKTNNSPSVTLWGTGTPRREFLFVDDLADALIHLMNTYEDPMPINVGVGEDISIRELAEMIQNIVGYTGEIIWDTSKPDGTPRKLMDVTKLQNTGWDAQTTLDTGIRKTYAWFINNYVTG